MPLQMLLRCSCGALIISAGGSGPVEPVAVAGHLLIKQSAWLGEEPISCRSVDLAESLYFLRQSSPRYAPPALGANRMLLNHLPALPRRGSTCSASLFAGHSAWILSGPPSSSVLQVKA